MNLHHLAASFDRRRSWAPFRTTAGAVALVAALTACADSNGTTPPSSMADELSPSLLAERAVDQKGITVDHQLIPARGTTFAVDVRGTGDPLLLIHGGGEDAGMMGKQAENLARAGYQVFAYDRRGTGRSGRDDWPGNGAAQHADDAAALIEAIGLERVTVVGVSSGGVVALALAARHPEAVGRVVAWEPPALGVVPGATAAQRALMAPARRHLRKHPGDFVGAQAILLKLILGVPVSVDDPAFAATRANAEAMIRDEPAIPVYRFRRRDLADVDVVIAVGDRPIVPIRVAARKVASWTGTQVHRVSADHEVYLSDPAVLTGIVTHRAP